jgi:hypothetical protein
MGSGGIPAGGQAGGTVVPRIGGGIHSARGGMAGQGARFDAMAQQKCKDDFLRSYGGGRFSGLGGAAAFDRSPEAQAALAQACPPQGAQPPAPAPAPAPPPTPGGPTSPPVGTPGAPPNPAVGPAGPVVPPGPVPGPPGPGGGGPEGIQQRIGAGIQGAQRPEQWASTLGTGVRQQLDKPPGWVGNKLTGLLGLGRG